jgi:hypothetical protein
MEDLYDELGKMSKLGSIGTALAQFAESLTEGEFKLESRAWVFRPCNFVTFRLTWKRKRSEKIALSLWGGRALHSVESPELKLWAGRWADYRSCDVTLPRQLAAAAVYIEKAFKLYRGSRNWPKGRD